MAVLATAAFAFTVTYLFARLISRTIGFRVDPEVESERVDEAQHAETAYDVTPLTSSIGRIT